MTVTKVRRQTATRTVLALLGIAACFSANADQHCEDAQGFSFICNVASAEDLVHVPGTQWILASGFSTGASLYLVDSGNKQVADLYPGSAPRAEQDMASYGGCPGSPDPNNFVAHGLNLRWNGDETGTLYVVGHGEREAIEVFAVDAAGESPELTWTGCILTPDGMAANSVTSLSDGSLLVTIPLYNDVAISEALAGKPTGAVYAWSPGDAAMLKVEGTEMPYANGIEVSADEEEFFVASSGLFTVTAFSNSNPAEKLRETETFGFVPDNLHRGPDGRLLTAGLNVKDSVCGDVKRSQDFDLNEFASCPRPFTVLAIDPASLETDVIVASPAISSFSNVTMAVPVGDEIWIGTFAGDRIAYRPLPATDQP